ncbi:PAS domain-containing protein, partial [Streptomyces sp. URMC 123]|uniref:PAS domain-containing protein n=1 Tax=Streptomyces sp. URMC 123 TaxID=3423403 RepID=UPI003F1B3A01
MSSRPSRGAARLAAILDALPDALLLVNCNGTVVNANTIALETFETPGTALVGRGLLSLLPDFDPKLIPGSMRRPAAEDRHGRTKPTRMVARRTDGTEFPVEVTSANLDDARMPYADPSLHHYTGDELLMLVVRDLTGTVDTEAELARQQRQTEMILRAAAEGVVGVDTEGKVVLVNPSAAQILGYRASDLGGQELHPLIHHSRADGSPLPYEESPLADTLRSGRKHRVRGQVLWAKNGRAVPVDLTTAPVRDGEQLVGAVMTFLDRRPYDALAARHAQLLAVLDDSLRGPLSELRAELGTLAADPAGQLWPEANQILHHLAAGYARMTTLVDNVLDFQRVDAGEDRLAPAEITLDEVVSAGVEGAIELIGPGRAQFAVHAPPLEVQLDPERMARALAHLIADVAGVDATGNAPAAGGGSGDSTIVVAAAQRGDSVRIEVRGPYPGGHPVHEPLARGIVRRHGGTLRTHEAPGMSGSAHVLELPMTAVSGPVAPARPRTGTGAGSRTGTDADSAARGGAGGAGGGDAASHAGGDRGHHGGHGGHGGQGSHSAHNSHNGHGSQGSQGGSSGQVPAAREAQGALPAGAAAAAGGLIAVPAQGTAPGAAPQDGPPALEPPRPTGRRRARRGPESELPPGADRSALPVGAGGANSPGGALEAAHGANGGADGHAGPGERRRRPVRGALGGAPAVGPADAPGSGGSAGPGSHAPGAIAIARAIALPAGTGASDSTGASGGAGGSTGGEGARGDHAAVEPAGNGPHAGAAGQGPGAIAPAVPVPPAAAVLPAPAAPAPSPSLPESPVPVAPVSALPPAGSGAAAGGAEARGHALPALPSVESGQDETHPGQLVAAHDAWPAQDRTAQASAPASAANTAGTPNGQTGQSGQSGPNAQRTPDAQHTATAPHVPDARSGAGDGGPRPMPVPDAPQQPTGRRRGRPSPAEEAQAGAESAAPPAAGAGRTGRRARHGTPQQAAPVTPGPAVEQAPAPAGPQGAVHAMPGGPSAVEPRPGDPSQAAAQPPVPAAGAPNDPVAPGTPGIPGGPGAHPENPGHTGHSGHSVHPAPGEPAGPASDTPAPGATTEGAAANGLALPVVPPQAGAPEPGAPTGRRARRLAPPAASAEGAGALPRQSNPPHGDGATPTGPYGGPAADGGATVPAQGGAPGGRPAAAQPQPTGRRARRALADATERVIPEQSGPSGPGTAQPGAGPVPGPVTGPAAGPAAGHHQGPAHEMPAPAA